MSDNIQPETRSSSADDKPLSANQIAWHPRFPEAEALVARRLIGLQEKTPRLARLKSSHRKWLITHSLFALSSQRTPEDPLSGLTASRLTDVVIQIGAASRNTATAFLKEMLAYKFLREIPNMTDRRVRVLEPTEVSVEGMRTWFESHMEGLDLLDGGSRMATCAADPSLFRKIHLKAAGLLVASPEWRDPRPGVSLFVWTDAGGMILHDLITRLAEAEWQGDRILLGPIGVAGLARHYGVSVSNVKRMFAKAEAEGLAGWTEPRRQGLLWISRQLLEDYFHWQSFKFEALDKAFHQVVAAG